MSMRARDARQDVPFSLRFTEWLEWAFDAAEYRTRREDAYLTWYMRCS